MAPVLREAAVGEGQLPYCPIQLRSPGKGMRILADHFLPPISTAPFSFSVSRKRRTAPYSADGTKMLYESPLFTVDASWKPGQFLGQAIEALGACSYGQTITSIFSGSQSRTAG